MAPSKISDTVPYILKTGESVDSIAKINNLTLDELTQLNQFRSFSKPFKSLSVGDEIDIPRRISLPLMGSGNEVSDTIPPSPQEELLARGMMTGGALLSGNDTRGAVVNMAHSAVVNDVNNSTQQWLNQFGTARVQLNMDDNFRLEGSAVDILIPIQDNKTSLLFSQLGVRQKDNRNTVNIGAGVRVNHHDWMYGANTFFDHDMTGNNRRVGAGVEAWTDYLKLSANRYVGLTGWHPSRDIVDYNERPANGYDFRAEAYLPAYPQLGGRLMYEKYRGNEVALFGKDNRQKNPYAMTSGINYTPIPLFTVGAERRTGKGDNRDTRIHSQLNYRLGESWQSHITPSDVITRRALTGSRYDLVERNNNIVLDYKKIELIQLSLPEQMTGSAFETTKINAQVTVKHGLKRIDWDVVPLVSAGAVVTQTSLQAISIRLPPYQLTGDNRNIYMLGAVAYDNQGNASKRSTTQIVVTQQRISELNSITALSHPSIPADGMSTSLVTVRLNDENNQPVQGMGTQLTLDVHFTPDSGVVLPSSIPALSVITETAPGVYTSQLTAGLVLGEAIIVPAIGQQRLASASIILTEDTSAMSPDNTLFSLIPDTIIADGIERSTLSLTARDIHNNPVKGLAVVFNVTGVGGMTLTSITENNGVYSAKLGGVLAGTATVIPSVNGIPIVNLSSSVVLVADNSSAILSLTVMTDGVFANGVATNAVQASVNDRQGNPVQAHRVAFTANNGAIMVASALTDVNGVALVTLTNTHSGITTVTADINGYSQRVDTSFIVEPPVSVLVYRNGVALTDNPVVDETLVAVPMCSTALCNATAINVQWEMESFAGSGVFIAISGATSETLTVTKNLQKRAIRVVSY
ncbi:hypothetical protein CRN84_05590 [Budvicia aquatica]|uniref:Invasin n=3 Tax=Budvicia aquatica TaxID=82979 RepID=A0A2C6DQK3_9GAMM|nr:hypothetical protein CRN84_05590 [Budvicia aquatica]